jgi:flagellar motor switch protein FliM
MNVSKNSSESHSSEYKNVKKYDFKKALRLSMEQIRVLTRIHENFAYLLSSSISTQLRTIVHVEVESVEQLLYEEFIKRLPSTTILNVFEAAEFESRMVMEMKPQMAFTILERLLGGRDTATFPKGKSNLTQIETKVLRKLFDGFVSDLGKSWKGLADVHMTVIELETNPQFLKIAIPSEIVIVVTFHITIGDMTELMHLCVPYIVLEPVIEKLSAYQWFSKRQKIKSKEDDSALKGKLHQVTIPVVAELGRATITIEEFLELAVGDVIQLDQLAEELIQVRVGNEVKFLGRPGTKQSRMAVQIEKVLGEGEHNHDE